MCLWGLLISYPAWAFLLRQLVEVRHGSVSWVGAGQCGTNRVAGDGWGFRWMNILGTTLVPPW